jgi:hypothetical protein
MVRPRADAGLALRKALVVFVTVWKVRRSVGKVGKRIWSAYMYDGPEGYLEGMEMRSSFETNTSCCCGGELAL